MTFPERLAQHYNTQVLYYFFCSDKSWVIFISGKFDKLEWPCNVSTRLKETQKEVLSQ